jgi:hypothetical protein
MTELNLLDIIEDAEQAEETVKHSSKSTAVTLFKSNKYKNGKRTETSLIDEAIIQACEALHAKGITQISFFAVHRVYDSLNPDRKLKKRDRVYRHVNAEQKQDDMKPFISHDYDNIIFKPALYNALELEVPKALQTKTFKKNAK